MFHNAHLYPPECIRELLLSIPYQDYNQLYYSDFFRINQLSSPCDRAVVTEVCIQLINEWLVQHPYSDKSRLRVYDYDFTLFQVSDDNTYVLHTGLSPDDKHVCFIMFTLMQKLYCDIH